MHRSSVPKGTLEKLVFDSVCLQENKLGDPSTRDLYVYLPPSYKASQKYPLLVELAPFTNSGSGRIAWKNFGENIVERLDRLIHEGMPPVVVAFPDCFTRLGGNQYINNPVLGAYETYLIEEIVPFVEKNFHCGGEGFRACYGRSSGGYGALYHGMNHSSFWSAVACHSGDMAFDLVYLKDVPLVLNELAKYDYTIEKFFSYFETALKVTSKDILCLNFLAMAASYDPDPQAFLGIRLPVDPYTAEVIPERWRQWLSYDPLMLAPQKAEGLKQLKGLFIDCGSQDQYHLHYGARRLTHLLKKLGVPHVYEEFDDDHNGIDYRLDTSLPYLVTALFGK
jgi:enterochelin esterase-like enzyme